MKNLIKANIVIVLCLLFLLPIILGIGIRSIPGNIQPSLDKTIKVLPDTKIDQEFISSEDNLSIIGLSIKNPNLASTDELTMDVYVGNTLSRTVNINGKNIPDGDFIKLRFTPIASTKSQSIKIEFSSKQASKDTPLELFASDVNSPNEVLLVNNRLEPGQLSFTPFYQQPNFLISSFKIYANLFINLSRDLGFVIFYGVIILAVVVLLVI